MRNPPSLFRMVRSMTPIRHSLPTKWGSQMHPTGRNSRRLLPPGEYDRRYRQNFLFHKKQCRLSPNYFGPCYFIVSMCIWHYNRLIIIIRLLISLTIALSSDNRPAYPLSVRRITLSIYLCSQIALNLPHRPLPVSYRVLSETVTLELFVFLFVQNQRRLARTTESSTVTRAVCLSVTGPRVPKIQRAESRPGSFFAVSTAETRNLLPDGATKWLCTSDFEVHFSCTTGGATNPGLKPGGLASW